MHLATNDRETKEECVTGLPQARLVQWPTKATGPALSPLHLQASCPHFISKRGQGQRARDVSQPRVSLSQSFLRSPSHSFHLTGRIWDPWPPLAARESGKVVFFLDTLKHRTNWDSRHVGASATPPFLPVHPPRPWLNLPPQLRPHCPSAAWSAVAPPPTVQLSLPSYCSKRS